MNKDVRKALELIVSELSNGELVLTDVVKEAKDEVAEKRASKKDKKVEPKEEVKEEDTVESEYSMEELKAMTQVELKALAKELGVSVRGSKSAILGRILEKLDVAEVEEEEPVTEEADEEVIDIEAKPEITFDDFGKMQFQVGEIIACEEVKKSKKLLCSQVKIGSEVKQIVSGIKKHYSAEEMVGKKVMVLVNLKPAKLAGVLSEGMLLCAEDAEGNLALMTPEKNMPAGAEIC